ncbi:MAG: hypothetical protein LBR33_00665 [Propionibacteriaceae bacterium]|jgi:hypothetical protein|nr:hypothetical protein [Propionibacteriaceae bacterium]
MSDAEGELAPSTTLEEPAPAPAAPKKRNKAAPGRIVAIAVGVPVLLCLLFVVLYSKGVIRDEQRANYCAVYAPLSADLSVFSAFGDDLAEGDPATVIAAVTAVRAELDQLSAKPSTPVIENRLKTMTDYLREVEVAARAHDDAQLAALNDRLVTFTSDRQEFLRQSAEYCRYR